MSDETTGATPTEVKKDETPPVPPVATPPVTPPATTPPVDAPREVTLSQEAHDQLQKDAARGSTNQRKADLYDKTIGKKGKGHFQPTAPVEPPSEDEQAQAALAEDRKAERGLLAIVADPAYRTVLDADPTLRDLLTSNPLAALPMLAPDALDADDAISLVKEALEKRATSVTPPTTPPATPAGETPPATETPPVGAVNPGGDQPVNAEVEEAKKNPNTESAIAGMVGARLKEGAEKKT